MSDRAPVRNGGGAEWSGDALARDLLAEHAIGVMGEGVDVREAAAIERAVGEPGAAEEVERLELAAAAVMVAEVERLGAEAMPATLRERLEDVLADRLPEEVPGGVGGGEGVARPAVAGRIESKPALEEEGVGGSKLFATLGWLAAAAAIGVAAVIYSVQPAGSAPASPQEALAELEGMEGTLEWSFTPWEDRADAEGFDADGVTGRVVWNTSEQRGVMVFEGLPKNDPRRLQYQLWIVVPDNEQAHPIDGGVFDVEQAEGPVIIPIDAKLAVERRPNAFAVTAEKPGGVVVSSQERRVAIAQPPQG